MTTRFIYFLSARTVGFTGIWIEYKKTPSFLKGLFHLSFNQDSHDVINIHACQVLWDRFADVLEDVRVHV